MPRILFDARPLVESTGGIPRVAARVLAHVRATRMDAEITLITTGATRPDLSVIAPGLRHLHLTLPNKLWSALCVFNLASLDRTATRLAGHAFDELILPNVGFVGATKLPTTIVVHDLSFLMEPRWFPRWMRLWHHAVHATRLIRTAVRVWCVSETTARDVGRLLNVASDRIAVLPQEIIVGSGEWRVASGSVPRTTHHAPLTPPYVLAFDGSVRKNTATAIAAVERVREDDRFRDLQLIVIGRPTNHAPRTTHPWLTHRSVTDTELVDLYAHARALLYPSWYEGFGLPLHEAAACHPEARRGTSVLLASAHGAIPETAPAGTLLINPAKPHLWASALRDVLGSAR